MFAVTRTDEIARVYDRLAERYAREIDSELDGKPLDRALLRYIAESAQGRGPVGDLGCAAGRDTWRATLPISGQTPSASPWPASRNCDDAPAQGVVGVGVQDEVGVGRAHAIWGPAVPPGPQIARLRAEKSASQSTAVASSMTRNCAGRCETPRMLVAYRLSPNRALMIGKCWLISASTSVV